MADNERRIYGALGYTSMKERWAGIYKLIEEMGELSQVIGKLGPFPDGKHPDNNGSLVVRLNEELTDVEAAIAYFRSMSGLVQDNNRFLDKTRKFNRWGLSGITTVKE